MYSDIPSFILKKDCIEEKFTLLSKQNEKYSIKLQKKNGSQYEVFFYENTKLKYNRLIFLSKSQDIYAKKSDNHVFGNYILHCTKSYK